LLIAASSFAAATVRMTGTVRDAESGAVIANALVSLSALHRSVLTGEDGRYSIDALPGTQRVVVSRMGFAGQEFDAIIPESGDLEINIAMRCEPIRFPAIRVRAALPLRGLAPSTGLADKSVSRDELNHDPVHIEPDFLRAMSGGDVVIDPENPSGLHVRGGASDQVGYMVDGIPVFNPYHSAGTFSAWNPDAISHVDLLASAATPAAPDALSGTVSARTRTLRVLSTIPAEASVRPRPAPPSTVRWVIRARGICSASRPRFRASRSTSRRRRTSTATNVDLLSKIEAPLLGGALRGRRFRQPE
jgi:hypothetical protein